MMYGWRGKIGIIIPSINNTMEPEFNTMAPEGISVYATRIFFDEGVPKQMERMIMDAEDAAVLLKTANVNGIVYGCTSSSLIKGVGSDLDIIRKIQERSGLPATTTATAVIAAFKELGVSTVAIATPYIEDVNKVEKEFIESHGFRVLNIQGLCYTTGEQLHRETPESAYVFAKQVDHPDADCLFISCTDFPTIEVLNCLEQDLGKPVLSSNTASFWAALKNMNIRVEIEAYGEILRRL
jgi:maleate cis-trans isomerase